MSVATAMFDDGLPEWARRFFEWLQKIEAKLDALAGRQAVKAWYTPEEFGRLPGVGLRPFTVREHCRLHRRNASKRRSGRGKYPAWVINHEEYLRYLRDGLLPPGNGRT